MLKAAVDWQSFIDRYWEKQPVQLDRLGVGPVLDAAEVWRALVGKSDFSSSDRFWVRHGNDFQQADLSLFGPKPSDPDLSTYLNRIQTGVGARSFGLNLQSLQVSSATIWFAFREFFEGLFARVPLPSQRWDIDCFLGTYRTTPFGIHADSASVFAVGLVGKRVYYTWPQSYFEKGHPDLHRCDEDSWSRHLDQAVRLELSPGQAIYWPSSHWHVVTSDGGPSMVIQLSAYFGVSLARYMGHLVSDFLEKELPSSHCLAYSHSGQELKDALQLLDRERLEQRLEQAWLTRLSADGFMSVPPLDPELQIPERLQLKPGVRLFSSRQGPDRKIFCNGLSFLVREQPLVSEILEAVQAAGGQTKPDFLGRFSSCPRLAESILLGLARRRAFV